MILLTDRSDFRMRKSADELVREAAALTALIEAAGQRLAAVAVELGRAEGQDAVLDPRFGLGTWSSAYESALSSFPRRLRASELAQRAALLADFEAPETA
jgi:hypothetical protein